MGESDDKIGAGGESLPLGFLPSGLLLVVFTLIKSSTSLLLVAARAGHQDGFPFLFETVLVFPFTMQALFYTGQTCMSTGFFKGLGAIKAAASSMGPCLFYAGFVTSTTLLETYSLQFILPSTFVVLKQLTMVVIAVGEVLIFAARPSRTAWLLIFSQALCVGLFQYSSSFPVAPPRISALEASRALEAVTQGGVHSVHDAASAAIGDVVPITPALGPAVIPALSSDVVPTSVLGISPWATGMTACLVSVATGGFGNILQQRFMQRQAKSVPVSVKLFYQHIIELILVMLLLSLRPEGRIRLWAHGFFGGWNQWTSLVSITMWFSFLSASAISAYISAIAGAFSVAVSVALTGVFEFFIFDRIFTTEQFILMAAVCVVAMLYTRERVAKLSGEEKEAYLDGGRKLNTKRRVSGPQECQALCEFGLDDVPLYHEFGLDVDGTHRHR